MSAHHAFHWPDHVIGKRESRRIRDEHNALFNSHAELLSLLKETVFKNDAARIDEDVAITMALLIPKMRAAIAKAEGGK